MVLRLNATESSAHLFEQRTSAGVPLQRIELAKEVPRVVDLLDGFQVIRDVYDWHGVRRKRAE